jgi:hypothetical protein
VALIFCCTYHSATYVAQVLMLAQSYMYSRRHGKRWRAGHRDLGPLRTGCRCAAHVLAVAFAATTGAPFGSLLFVGARRSV